MYSALVLYNIISFQFKYRMACHWDILNIDLLNLLEPTSMLFDLVRWHGNCHQIKSNKVCHFANAIELGQIRSKTTILLNLIRSTSIRFSLGPSLASHCSQGGSWDELRGWKHLKICPYSYPIEFIPGDDFHLLNGVFHTMRLLPIMGLFSSHQGQKTLSSWIPPEWKNGNYSSTSCSFIISFILLVVNFQTVCYTMCILVLPQLWLQASSSHSRAGFEPELSWVRSDQSCSSARPAVAAVLAQELTWESKLCVVVFSDIWPVTTLITYFSNQLENTGFKGERTERCTALVC
jgi:hypothetical protein